jgi:hypothetical protein
MTIMSVVEQKKERIRVALQELDHPTSQISAGEAMSMLLQTICDCFDDDGSIGDFVGDNDFKEEIFSDRVIQVVMDVSQDKEEYPPSFYKAAHVILYSLCSKSTELATTFTANGGVKFLLECLVTFSSDQSLLVTCFAVYNAVIESLGKNESVTFAAMSLAKLVDVFELNYKTAHGMLYRHYCVAVSHSFGPGHEVNNSLIERIAFHVWHGILKHKHDEEAQAIGRTFLCRLIGKESAKEMIDRAEMHHF